MYNISRIRFFVLTQMLGPSFFEIASIKMQEDCECKKNMMTAFDILLKVRML